VGQVDPERHPDRQRLAPGGERERIRGLDDQVDVIALDAEVHHPEPGAAGDAADACATSANARRLRRLARVASTFRLSRRRIRPSTAPLTRPCSGANARATRRDSTRRTS
jgi:hypothetical protein